MVTKKDGTRLRGQKGGENTVHREPVDFEGFKIDEGARQKSGQCKQLLESKHRYLIEVLVCLPSFTVIIIVAMYTMDSFLSSYYST